MRVFCFKKFQFKLNLGHNLGLIILILSGCNDIFEKDISREEIIIQSPVQNQIIEENFVSFWWSEIENAQYQVILVEGTFSQPKKFVFDSIVSINNFNFPIYYGRFSWRIRAFNNGYETNWYDGEFEVVKNSDLTNKTIFYKNLPDTFFSNDQIIKIEWHPIDSVNNYIVKAWENSIWGFEILSDSLTNTYFDLEILNESFVILGVMATNPKSYTPFSYLPIYYDKTPPTKPILLKPINNQLVKDSAIIFKWEKEQLIGSQEFDTLIISNANTFQNIIRRTRVFNNLYVDSLGIGQFYWRIKSNDKCENQVYSDVESFIVN